MRGTCSVQHSAHQSTTLLMITNTFHKRVGNRRERWETGMAADHMMLSTSHILVRYLGRPLEREHKFVQIFIGMKVLDHLATGY